MRLSLTDIKSLHRYGGALGVARPLDSFFPSEPHDAGASDASEDASEQDGKDDGDSRGVVTLAVSV